MTTTNTKPEYGRDSLKKKNGFHDFNKDSLFISTNNLERGIRELLKSTNIN